MSYSISFYEASTYVGKSLVGFYFTTYDGDRYGIPLYNYDGGYYYFSRELKKSGNLYKMDYFLIIDNSYLYDYGEIYLDLGSTDNNRNGIDDFCEKSLAFNSSVTGNWYSYDGSSGSLNGFLKRSANSYGGSYTFTAYNTEIGNISLSGNFYVGTVSGTLNYSARKESISFVYTSKFDYESPPQTIETTYEILDQNKFRLNAKGIFPSTVFTRKGNVYSATFELTDGQPTTSWPDYQKWLVNIEDKNDWDGDGIPDLSDPPKPKAMPWIPLLLLDD
jgi:hypothetical protein